jgi:hypothetical protein
MGLASPNVRSGGLKIYNESEIVAQKKKSPANSFPLGESVA